MPLPTEPVTSLSANSEQSRARLLSVVPDPEKPRRAYRPPAERSVRLTDRDAAGVRLLCSLGAVRSDDMATWLAHASGRSSLGARSANQTLARWAKAGLASGRDDLRSARRVWLPTPQGARFADWTHPLHVPDLPHQQHSLTVAAVAIHYMVSGWRWLSWREASSDPRLGTGADIHGVAKSDLSKASVHVAVDGADVMNVLARLSAAPPGGCQMHLWITEEASHLLASGTREDISESQASSVRLCSLHDLLR